MAGAGKRSGEEIIKGERQKRGEEKGGNF